MATFRMVKRPSSSTVTTTFDYYNEALSFYEASKMLNPSKPFKKGIQWCVTFLRLDAEKAVWEKVDDWNKPYEGCNDWRGVLGLENITPYVSQAAINLH